MYRLILDYACDVPLGHHWYGSGDAVRLPALPGHTETFFNVISLDPTTLPIRISAKVPRIYLPHRFDSDLGLDDIYFQIQPSEVVLLAPLSPPAELYGWCRDLDLRPRNATFELLDSSVNPASPNFNREALTYPHHQLGGTPYFIQISPHRLSCIVCGAAMEFLLQFHSDDKLVSFEDSGCAYYWWCAECSVVGCHTDSL